MSKKSQKVHFIRGKKDENAFFFGKKLMKCTVNAIISKRKFFDNLNFERDTLRFLVGFGTRNNGNFEGKLEKLSFSLKNSAEN